jgi:hypothetical protein
MERRVEKYNCTNVMELVQDYAWYAAISVAVIEAVVVCWSVWEVVASRRREKRAIRSW